VRRAEAGGLERLALDVAEVRRTYWLAHGWPGGPQYRPARVIGRVPWHLDASEILLDMVIVG